MAVEGIDDLSLSRRKIIGGVFGAFSAASAVSFLYPLGRYLWPRSSGAGADGKASVKLSLTEVPAGGAKFIRFLNKPAVVINLDGVNVAALSAVCTHLGCVIKWNSRAGQLQCPCHGGKFNTDGMVVGGPPPVALPTYAARIESGYIIVEEADENGTA